MIPLPLQVAILQSATYKNHQIRNRNSGNEQNYSFGACDTNNKFAQHCLKASQQKQVYSVTLEFTRLKNIGFKKQHEYSAQPQYLPDTQFPKLKLHCPRSTSVLCSSSFLLFLLPSLLNLLFLQKLYLETLLIISYK